MKYPLFKVHVGDVSAVLERFRQVLESGFINEGEEVTQFTSALSTKLNANHLVLVNSCTSALTLSLRLAGVKHGDVVVSTPMTCLATNCPIVNLGAHIQWADVDPDTGCIDPDDVERLLSSTRAKVVMAVAWAGTPPNLKDLNAVCTRRGAKLILDAAHAMKATYMSLPVHRWANYTCYSLQAIKHITTGDGGALVLTSKSDFERAKCLKWFGIDREKAKDASGNWRGQHWDEDVPEAGYKFNMNNLTAAFGIGQLDRVDQIIEAHKRNAVLYSTLFEESRYVTPLRHTMGSSHWVYGVRLKEPRQGRLESILAKLNGEGIGAGVVHVRNDKYRCFASSQGRQLPGVEEFSRSQFNLPVGWWLDSSDIVHIAKRTEEACKEVR